ncbi:helix-turn-helix domain-containing protein [Kaistia sp. MMO-174]|uniref:helix-turn-helix domain-containing protein n=1 Tax=Kaistia sp. MMO-174 TaxID=3081256 RepID=UPI00301B53E4
MKIEVSSEGMAPEIRNLRIVALAQAGKPPSAIAEILSIPVGTVYNAIRQARMGGIVIPVFSQRTTPPRGNQSRRVPEDHSRPAAAPKPEAAQRLRKWTFEDDQKLTELMGRNVRLTGIAAIMRYPYATIIAAAERLGLTRAGASS